MSLEFCVQQQLYLSFQQPLHFYQSHQSHNILEWGRTTQAITVQATHTYRIPTQAITTQATTTQATEVRIVNFIIQATFSNYLNKYK